MRNIKQAYQHLIPIYLDIRLPINVIIQVGKETIH